MLEALRDTALEAYDRIIGLRLSEVAVNGCITKDLSDSFTAHYDP
jgi:hypothetical protein